MVDILISTFPQFGSNIPGAYITQSMFFKLIVLKYNVMSKEILNKIY